MNELYQLRIDGKTVADITFADFVALAAIIDPSTVHEFRPDSLECGRFEIQRYNAVQ